MSRSFAMNALDVMTQSIVSVRPEASVLAAARLMLEHKVSGLPVVDADGALVGVITEGDFLRRAEIGAERRRPRWIEFFTGPGQLAEEYIQASGRRVRDIMSAQVCTATEATSLREMAQLMETRGIKRLPVMRGDDLVGIVTRADLVRAVVSMAEDTGSHSASEDARERAFAVDDAEIRRRLEAELKRQPWAVPASMIQVSVKDGVVELSGVVRDERQRHALRIAAEGIPGVRSVGDRALRLEPVIGLFATPNED
jgi:CBS domain-containing protein